MKKTISSILTITLIFISISGCNSSNSKKEAAKNYVKSQTVGTTNSPEGAKAASNDVVILTDQSFDKTVAKGIVLVDFWATWCGPCKVQGPIVEQIAKEMKGKVTVCKLDTDKNLKTSQRFEIQYLPTILIFKDGKVVDKLVGMTQKEALLNALKKVL